MEIPTQCVYVSLHQHFRTRPALTKIIALDFSLEGNWMSKCQSCRHDSLQYTNIEYSTIADRAINWGNMICGNCCIFPEMFFQGSEIWACGKWGAPGQRWIDLLRLGWSLSPWPTGSTGSRLQQPPSRTGVLSVHPSWAMQHQQPRQLGCSTFTCFTTQGWCVCLGKGSSCLMQQAAVSTLQRHSTLGMALLTAGAEPHPSCCSRSSNIYLLWVQPLLFPCLQLLSKGEGWRMVSPSRNALPWERRCCQEATSSLLFCSCVQHRNLPSVSNAILLLKLKFCS